MCTSTYDRSELRKTATFKGKTQYLMNTLYHLSFPYFPATQIVFSLSTISVWREEESCWETREELLWELLHNPFSPWDTRPHTPHIVHTHIHTTLQTYIHLLAHK